MSLLALCSRHRPSPPAPEGWDKDITQQAQPTLPRQPQYLHCYQYHHLYSSRRSSLHDRIYVHLLYCSPVLILPCTSVLVPRPPAPEGWDRRDTQQVCITPHYLPHQYISGSVLDYSLLLLCLRVTLLVFYLVVLPLYCWLVGCLCLVPRPRPRRVGIEDLTQYNSASS